MTQEQVLEAKARETRGSVRKLRRQGRIPAIVYGDGLEATAISVPEKPFNSDSSLRKTLVELNVDGQKMNVMIHELQRDPISKKVMHIDFYRVRLDQPIDTKVSVHVAGVEEVEKRGGIVQQQIREIELHALPNATPKLLTVDVSSLGIGQHVTAGDLELPAGVNLRSDAGEVVVTVLVAKRGGQETESENAAGETTEPAE